MKKILVGMLLAVGGLQAQNPPQVLQLQEPPLPVVQPFTVNYVGGQTGVTSYWYWIVTRYQVGKSNLSAPVVVNNITAGVGSVVLSWIAPTTNTNQAAWANPAVPLTYDVLRTTSATFPSNGNCIGCLVGTVNFPTATDTLGSLADYATSTYIPSIYTLYIDNTSALVNAATPDLAINDGPKNVGIGVLQWANNQNSKNVRVNNNLTGGQINYTFMENGINKGVVRYRGTTSASPANDMDFGTINTGGQARIITGNGLPAITCDPNQVCTFTNPCVGCGSGGTPGAPDGSIQANFSGAFAGIPNILANNLGQITFAEVQYPSTCPNLAIGGVGVVTAGNPQYAVAYVTALGQTYPQDCGGTSIATAGNTTVLLASIPISTDSHVIGRLIYRTVSDPNGGGYIAGMYERIHYIADNTTTTYTDNTIDANLDNSVSNPTFTSGTNWSVTGGAAFSGGHAVFSSTGTLTQVAANLAISILQFNEPYVLTYTISGLVGTPSCFATVAGSGFSMSLPLSGPSENGLVTGPGDVVISCTVGGGSSVTFNSISVMSLPVWLSFNSNLNITLSGLVATAPDFIPVQYLGVYGSLNIGTNAWGQSISGSADGMVNSIVTEFIPNSVSSRNGADFHQVTVLADQNTTSAYPAIDYNFFFESISNNGAGGFWTGQTLFTGEIDVAHQQGTGFPYVWGFWSGEDGSHFQGGFSNAGGFFSMNTNISPQASYVEFDGTVFPTRSMLRLVGTPSQTGACEEYASTPSIGGAQTVNASISCLGVFNSGATQTTVNGSGSGSAIFSQPFAGSSWKSIVIRAVALTGTASYTYPVAFTVTPSCVASGVVACSVLSSTSTTAVTITGAATSGFVTLEGY